MLKIESVTKKYGQFTAVDALSFSVEKGRILGLLGPNGAGKTSTIRMIAGITLPDSGRITFDGIPAGPASQMLMGYLPEERGLYKRMTVLEGIQFLGELKQIPAREARKKGLNLLEEFGLADWQNKKIEALSKGMQQKVQILTTILHDPDLIILDEPLSGLDPINAELVNTLIMDLKNKGKIILFSTHRMEQVEKICDDIVLINKGIGVLNGPLNEIRKKFGTDSIIIGFDGDASVLNRIAGITLADIHPKHAEIKLNGTPLKPVIAFLNEHLDLHRVERVSPSLKDIFIRTVTEQGFDLEAGGLE